MDYVLWCNETYGEVLQPTKKLLAEYKVAFDNHHAAKKENTVSVIVEDGIQYTYDKVTGEILKVYRSPHLFTDYSKFTCKDSLREWCLEHGFKKSHRLRSNLGYVQELAGKDYVKALLLANEIEYINVVFQSTNQLACLWNVKSKNVIRTLDSLQEVGVLTWDRIKRGEYRIAFNPQCFTKNPLGTADHYEQCKVCPTVLPQKPKIKAVEGFDLLAPQAVNTTVSPYKDDVELEPLDYTKSSVERLNNKYGGDRLYPILHCSDVSLELFLAGHLSIDQLK